MEALWLFSPDFPRLTGYSSLKFSGLQLYVAKPNYDSRVRQSNLSKVDLVQPDNAENHHQIEEC